MKIRCTNKKNYNKQKLHKYQKKKYDRINDTRKEREREREIKMTGKYDSRS